MQTSSLGVKEHNQFTTTSKCFQITEGDKEASRTVSYPVTIAAVADPVAMEIQPVCLDSNNVTMVSLEIDVTQDDQDGSEILELYVSGLSDGTTVTSKIPDNVTVSRTNGREPVVVWTIKPAWTKTILNISADSGHLNPVSINITVVSMETSNQDKYEYSQTVDLELCTNVTLPPQGDVTSPPGANVTEQPGVGVTTGPPGIDVTTGPPGVYVTTGPPGVNVATGPPGVDITTGPPGVDVTTGPPGVYVTTGPPGVNVATGPPGVDISTGPPGVDVTTGPPGVDVTFTTEPPGVDVTSPEIKVVTTDMSQDITTQPVAMTTSSTGGHIL